jgi:hypothetical protein
VRRLIALVLFASLLGARPAAAQDMLSPINPMSPVSQSLAANAMENSGGNTPSDPNAKPHELSGTALALIIGFSVGAPIAVMGGIRLTIARSRKRYTREEAVRQRERDRRLRAMH